jgi:hypothetical protein
MTYDTEELLKNLPRAREEDRQFNSGPDHGVLEREVFRLLNRWVIGIGLVLLPAAAFFAGWCSRGLWSPL